MRVGSRYNYRYIMYLPSVSNAVNAATIRFRSRYAYRYTPESMTCVSHQKHEKRHGRKAMPSVTNPPSPFPLPCPCQQ